MASPCTPQSLSSLRWPSSLLAMKLPQPLFTPAPTTLRQSRTSPLCAISPTCTVGLASLTRSPMLLPWLNACYPFAICSNPAPHSHGPTSWTAAYSRIDSHHHQQDSQRGGDLQQDYTTCLATAWSKDGIRFWLFQKHSTCPSSKPFGCTTGWKVTLVGSRFTSGAESHYALAKEEAPCCHWCTRNGLSLRPWLLWPHHGSRPQTSPEGVWQPITWEHLKPPSPQP